MKKIFNRVTSMQVVAILLFVFAISIGYATFIENDFGTQTAKAVVFNARWFEFLLLFLAIALISNIIRFKMYNLKKPLVLLFHMAFIIILIGAAVTRYLGYEGTMHIREGMSENRITSSETFIELKEAKNILIQDAIYLSKISSNSYEKSFDVEGTIVDLKLVEYIPNAVYKLIEDPNGTPMVKLMITGGGAPDRVELSAGEVYENDNIIIDFNSGKMFLDIKPVIKLYVEGSELKMAHTMPLNYLKMDDQSRGVQEATTHIDAAQRTLFTVNRANFVIREFLGKAKKVVASDNTKMSKMPRMRDSGLDALRFEISSANEKKEIIVMGRKGAINSAQTFTIEGKRLTLRYGAIFYTLPFSIKLEKFDLDRYPGSASPMSYASDVILIDKEKNLNERHRIYMNHVLEHRGYRFFQSSFDQDEKGTVLSVNHDPGTLPTYIGYFLLALGMYGSLFAKNGRFQGLLKKAKKAASEQKSIASLLLAISLLVAGVPSLKAEELSPSIKTILSFDKKHSNHFGELIIQDSQGRMKPLDTLNMEVLQKIARSDTFLGLNANQVILGMIIRPDVWRDIKMIRTSHKAINKIVGLDSKEKSASFSQFFEYPDEMNGYKLADAVNEAIRKAPGKRDKFDKAVLKVDERVNIAYMIYSGTLLKLFAKPNDINNKWYSIVDAIESFSKENGLRVREEAVAYFTNVEKALSSGNWSDADRALDNITEYQKFYGARVYPDDLKVKLEIFYNHSKVFERLWPMYFLVGFILLFLSFTQIIKPKLKIDLVSKGAFYLMVLFFIAHTVGLAIRWYISGHAPWSNGYESMVYIAWATLFAGYIFSKTSPITLASTGILSGLILFVAHLNWMDPQVTNLVPVLQSYWLSIHVSMITASYGFLGLGALLGFVTLILFAIMNDNNSQQIKLSIKELNAINEMSLMIGLVMLTVGNFLGGVWANESWGRYWGWDPKETWALVTILIYAIVVHLRFIKSLYTDFIYSAVSLMAFTSVLMTYFGVNYYLAGLHSYAKGDPVPIPDFVPVTYGIVFLLIFIASRNRKRV